MKLFLFVFFMGCHHTDPTDALPQKDLEKSVEKPVLDKGEMNQPVKPKGSIGGTAILPQTIVLGGIENKAVTGVLNQSKSSVDSCFVRVQSEKKIQKGKVLIKFFIAKSGRTEKVQVLSTTIRDRVTEDCLKSLVEGLRFPQPGKGSHAIVTHPFSFGESKG